MCYELCKRLLKVNKLAADMLDVFFAAGRLTESQYVELVAML